MPKGKRIVHATLDPTDINKDVPVELAAVGDAGLTLDALLEEVKDRLHGKPRGRLDGVTRGIGVAEERVAGAVDAAADPNDDAALALPRDLGTAARGRCPEHDHHP